VGKRTLADTRCNDGKAPKAASVLRPIGDRGSTDLCRQRRLYGLPTALPQILTGLQITLPISMISLSPPKC
jgi:hypothetical protein